jgi:hypothetical protein
MSRVGACSRHAQSDARVAPNATRTSPRGGFPLDRYWIATARRSTLTRLTHE